MARLILLDASVVIAALEATDTHHANADRALRGTTDDELLITAVTRAEVVVGAMRAGGRAQRAATAFAGGCVTVPVTGPHADDAAARRARHPALSLPDALTLAVADDIGVDEIWTFDQRWATAHPRVVIPT